MRGHKCPSEVILKQLIIFSLCVSAHLNVTLLPLGVIKEGRLFETYLLRQFLRSEPLGGCFPRQHLTDKSRVGVARRRAVSSHDALNDGL